MRWIQHPQTLELIPVDQYERPAPRGPLIIGDLKRAYTSPVTLRRIDSRRAQREDLARTGCRIADPSERAAFTTPTPDKDPTL